MRKQGNACGAKGPDWKHVTVDMKGVPLERRFHYGSTGRRIPDCRIREEDSTTGETLFTETETEPKGETGAEVPVLHIV